MFKSCYIFNNNYCEYYVSALQIIKLIKMRPKNQVYSNAVALIVNPFNLKCIFKKQNCSCFFKIFY